MTIEKRNLHLRLQEYCDCFVQTDFRKELETISKEGTSADVTGDIEEVALKFLGLAIMYGTTESAKKITLVKDPGGNVQFNIEAAGKYKLPSPSPELADSMFDVMRSITHLEAEKAGEPLSLGLKNDRLEIGIEFDSTGGKKTLSINFS